MRQLASFLSPVFAAMSIYNEREALHLEMPEAETDRDKAVLILIQHCKDMKRQERNSRIVTGLLFLGIAALILFAYVQKDSFSACEHTNKATNEGASAYQRQPGISPNAHLTAPSKALNEGEYFLWETKNGEAHLQGFEYKNHSLIVTREGRYHVYLQITYKMSKPCNQVMLPLWQAVVRFSQSYPEDINIMEATDSMNCSQQSSRKSVFSAGTFRMEKGDQLKVKARNHELIDRSETKMFFGALLI